MPTGSRGSRILRLVKNSRVVDDRDTSSVVRKVTIAATEAIRKVIEVTAAVRNSAGVVRNATVGTPKVAPEVRALQIAIKQQSSCCDCGHVLDSAMAASSC